MSLGLLTWPGIHGEPGQLQSLHFSLHGEKGALFCAEESAGDVPGTFHVLCSAVVMVFVGGWTS